MFYDSLYLCLNCLRWLPCVYPKRRLLLCWHVILNFSFMLGIQCALLCSGSFVNNYGCSDFVINHFVINERRTNTTIGRITHCTARSGTHKRFLLWTLRNLSRSFTSFPLSHLHGMQHRGLVCRTRFAQDGCRHSQLLEICNTDQDHFAFWLCSR